VCGAGAIAGMFAVLGHIFPIYLNFDGGKGYAAYIGLVIALHPIAGTAVFLLSVAFALFADYVVASTFFTIVAMPIVVLFTGNYFEAVVLTMTALIILVKHKENIKNLVSKNGKEMTIRAAIKKKYKKDGGGNEEHQ
jgi:glycerol-3-phosphate acyltransferase PlsY